MRAIILAGGKGTRLLPHTERIPKPLVSIGGDDTILDILIKQLVNSGFDHITIAVNHLAEMIKAHAGDGSKWGIKIDYSHEDKPLSTIGPLTLIPDLPENFIMVNGDTLADIDYGDLLKRHIKEKNRVTVCIGDKEIKIEFGVIVFDNDKRVVEFKEKPSHFANVAIGVNCFSRKVIEKLAKGERYGFDNLVNDSLTAREPVRIYEHKGFWLDIGRPADYQYAIENYESIKKLLKI
ncbi:MAG: sugar phosphate nucleotidyltransferase [Candidatus Paceibacterota bacterium]|jgi:NDP-sugar pyrophosphorylase family protein